MADTITDTWSSASRQHFIDTGEYLGIEPYRDGLRTREDGRQEVEDTGKANRLHGCTEDDWCILRDEHEGDCCEDREYAL